MNHTYDKIYNNQIIFNCKFYINFFYLNNFYKIKFERSEIKNSKLVKISKISTLLNYSTFLEIGKFQKSQNLQNHDYCRSSEKWEKAIVVQ